MQAQNLFMMFAETLHSIWKVIFLNLRLYICYLFLTLALAKGCCCILLCLSGPKDKNQEKLCHWILGTISLLIWGSRQKNYKKGHCFVWSVTLGAILLSQQTHSSCSSNELGYISVYDSISYILEEKRSHHASVRDSTLYLNLFRMQRQFLEEVNLHCCKSYCSDCWDSH